MTSKDFPAYRDKVLGRVRGRYENQVRGFLNLVENNITNAEHYKKHGHKKHYLRALANCDVAMEQIKTFTGISE